jgi:hypothetical protein
MLRLPLDFIVNLTSKRIILNTTLSDDEDILQIFMATLISIKDETYLYVIDMCGLSLVAQYYVGHSKNYRIAYFNTESIEVSISSKPKQVFFFIDTLINTSDTTKPVLMGNRVLDETGMKGYITYLKTLGKCYKIYNNLNNLYDGDLQDDLESLTDTEEEIRYIFNRTIPDTTSVIVYLIQDLEENYTEYYKAPIPYYNKELFNA